MDATTPAEPPPPPRPVMDNVGIFWIALTCVYTVLLVAGLVYLFIHRSHPSVRIRNPALTIAAVVNLHVYWVLCSTGYVLGPVYPEMLEFWVMNIYLPIGLALFHAANSGLLRVSRDQERCFGRVGAPAGNDSNGLRRVESTTKAKRSRWPWFSRSCERWRSLREATRVGWYITFAVLMQILLAVSIFCISRKFHPGWGIPGTEAPGDPIMRKLAVGRGWEWISSIGWQVFWAWIWAPYVLFKTRHIKDTHGWRLQTAVCCISGLPAAPLWLIALYVPAMGAVNKYWIPPNWICLSLTVMEIFTIFVPCYMVAFRSKALRAETLAAIRVWEAQKLGNGSLCTGSTSGTTDSGNGFVHFNGLVTSSETNLTDGNGFPNQRRKSIFRFLARAPKVIGISSNDTNTGAMFPPHPTTAPLNNKKLPAALFSRDALEHCLRLNPDPLQQFAARKDFSGENVAFLTSVREWKALCGASMPSRGHSTRTIIANPAAATPLDPPPVVTGITKHTSITITSVPVSSSFSRPFRRCSIMATNTSDDTEDNSDDAIITPVSPPRRRPSTDQAPRHNSPINPENPAQQQKQQQELTSDNERSRRRLFNIALRIYAASISYEHATFPVNLASKERKALEAVFGDAARTLFGWRAGRRGSAGSAGSNGSGKSEDSELTLWNAWGTGDGERHDEKDGLKKDGDWSWEKANTDAATAADGVHELPATRDQERECDGPFGPVLSAVPTATGTSPPPPPDCAHCGEKHSSLLPALHPVTGGPSWAQRRWARRQIDDGGDGDGDGSDAELGPEEILKGRGVWYYGPIPEGFGDQVFEKAEESVFGMVLMDTWPKFVRMGGGGGAVGV